VLARIDPEVTMPNPLEGQWFVAFSLLRNEHGLSQGYPIGKKGQLSISFPQGGGIQLELTHPGNPLRPRLVLQGTFQNGPPISFTATAAHQDMLVEINGFLSQALPPALRIVGGYVWRKPGTPGGESDGEGSWIASDERPPDDAAPSRTR
jgi:hypothetical protein